ncbi:MAG: sigma-70 family RNA polymerase sigma factor [Anaerolineales bacterium]|nr:sigma-70 family RNA polymerase sigma factor [Anaerolineales bacterium]
MAVTIEHVKPRMERIQPETTAFEALFQQHWERIVQVLYRLVGDYDEAQDLAVEVFWRMHRRPPSRPENLPGWLYRVAVNLGYNALRSRYRRWRYETAAGWHALETNAPPDPLSQVEQLETRRMVQQALVKMKSRSAHLLVMRHSGLSYAEIASALRVSPASVGTLLSRAEAEFERAYCALFGEQ